MGPLIPFAIGYLMGKGSGGFHLFGSSTSAQPISHREHPPLHRQHPAPVVHSPDPSGLVPVSYPQATSTAVHWEKAAPGGLPPFPSGWKPAHTDQAVVHRAMQLMPTLPVGETKYEASPSHEGGWLAYHASKEGKKKFVTAWSPKGVVHPHGGAVTT